MTPSTDRVVPSLARVDMPTASRLHRVAVRRAALLACLVLLAGLGLTAWLYLHSLHLAQSGAASRFEYRTDRIRAELGYRFTLLESSLESMAGLITAREGFNRQQWRRYFETLQSAEPYEGRLLVAFAPRVPAAERDAHEQQARADGLAHYAIRSSAQQSEYFPLAYMRRITAAAEFVIGADLRDDPAARDAMARALASGKTVLAGPLGASASTQPVEQVWGLLVAVYAGGKIPATAPEREAALLGFLIEVFAALPTVGGAIGPDASLIGLKVSEIGLSVPIFTCPELLLQLARGFQPSLVRDIDFEWGQRRWSLHFVALPDYLAAAGPDRPTGVLIAGVTISLLLAALVGALGNLRVRALASLHQRTASLRQALGQQEESTEHLRAVFTNALDAILIINTRGIVQTFNPAAERIFGWKSEEVVGRNVNMLMLSPHHERHDSYLNNYLAGGPAKIIGIGRAVTGQRKDGSSVALEVGVSELNIREQRYFCGMLRDITERNLAEEALRRSESRLRSYIDQSLDGMMVLDEHGHYLEANPALIEMLGYAEHELLSMSIQQTLWPDPTETRKGAAHFERVVSSGSNKGEVTLRRKNGQRMVAEINAVSLGGNRYLGILRDVTERNLAEQSLKNERVSLELRVNERTQILTRTNAALEQEIVERTRIEGELMAAREQALQAADAKASFLANMSHEIRTPMNAVVGMTALLDETALDPEQRNYVQTIRASGDALLTIISDILDFSKIESGMLELEQMPFELGACVEEAFDMLAPRAAEKGIDLLYEIADGIPPWLFGDSARLRQVFVNLLANAVKFTDRGEVCVSVNLSSSTADRVKLHFAVRDTGIGISPAQMRHLFKAFSQADSSTTRKYGGTGLGLTISARLVRMMGGELRVDSEEHRGSTFHFTVAFGVARELPSISYQSSRAPELEGKRILLVDDNPTNLQILQTQCRRWGMDVVTASRGPLALALLEAEPRFDVAVLDLNMPGMDGAHLAQSIHTQYGATAPALVLSSSGVRRGDYAGMKHFAARLAKPVKHSQLFAVLVQVLHPQALEPAAPARRKLDPTLAQRLPMQILVVEDSAINQRLAVGILAKLGYSSDVADNGQEALNLIARKRYDLVFMDLQMPVMDGLQATRRLSAMLAPHLRPRVVAMTANAMAGDRERCLDAGMDDYIAKPVLPSDVQALIERWAVRLATSTGHIAEQPLIDAGVISELAALDEPGSPALLRSLIFDYLSETPAAISAIKQHAESGELTELSSRAHKLAGVSASLGANGMSDVCCRIEQNIASAQPGAVPALIDELELRFALTRTEMNRLSRSDD